MRKSFKVLMMLLGSAMVLIFYAPILLYWCGLGGIEGRPQPPLHLACQEQKQWVWGKARGTGVPHVEEKNPYTYFWPLIRGEHPSNRAGAVVAWWVASDYLLTHQRHRGMGWWHLSGAALTIWVTRNWTSDEILTAAANGLQMREKKRKEASDKADGLDVQQNP